MLLNWYKMLVLIRTFSMPGGSGRNVIMFGIHMISSVSNDSKGKDILILGKIPTEGLYCTTLTAEKTYLINFTEHNLFKLFI